MSRLLIIGVTSLSLFFSCKDSSTDSGVPDPEPPPPEEKNRPPKITSNPPAEVNELEFYEYEIEAEDPDGDQISYSIVEGPDWLEVSNNIIYGNSQEINEDEVSSIKVRASDGQLHDEQDYDLTVQNLYNVHVVSEGDLSAIQEERVEFSESMDFEEGDIIVPDYSSSTSKSSLGGVLTYANWPGCDYDPQGFFLRKIVDVISDRIFQTEPATIEEAIRDNSFSIDEPLSLPTSQKYSGIEGVSMNTSQEGFSFNFDIDNVLLGGGEEIGTPGLNQIVANGNISFNSRFILEGEVDRLRLQELLFQNKTSGQADITISSNGWLVLPQREVPIFECTLPTIKIPAKIPIYITPKIDVLVGMGDSRTSLFEARVINEVNLEPGIAYENGSWDILDHFTNDFDFSLSGPDEGADVKAYAGPRLTLLLYDALGPRAGINKTMRLDAHSNNDWRLYGGLEASLGIDTGILSDFIPSHDQPFDFGEILLAEREPDDDIEPSVWTPINTGLTFTGISSLAVNSSGDIFAGDGGGTVYRSTNNGNNWTETGSLAGGQIDALAINSNGHIFAGKSNSSTPVSRSTNNGANWVSASTGLPNTFTNDLAINSDGHIFVGTSSAGIYRSTNNGDNWTEVNTGLEAGLGRVYSLAINSSGHIFAGTQTNTGIFRSTNNGLSWQRVFLAYENSTPPYNVGTSLAINSNGHIFAGMWGEVFRSTDSGTSWTQHSTGLPNREILAIAINSSGHIIAGTYGDGIYLSKDNGDSWTQINIGLTNLYIRTLVHSPLGNFFAGTQDGMFRGD